jgi:hypothetical protein
MDELRQQHLQLLGPELGPVYTGLCLDLRGAYVNWQLYQELFMQSSARLQLLNDTAAQFFWLVEENLRESTLLAIARLTDPPVSRGKHSLSLRRLPSLVDPALSRTLRSSIRVASSLCAPIEDWRNRLLAHRDLDLALSRNVRPLPPLERRDIGDALEACADVLNLIERHYFDATVLYSETILGLSNVAGLVHFLNWGRHYFDQWEAIAEGSNPADAWPLPVAEV